MNRIMTVDEAVKSVAKTMDETGLTKALAEASPADRDAMILELMNFFGARMPSNA